MYLFLYLLFIINLIDGIGSAVKSYLELIGNELNYGWISVAFGLWMRGLKCI